MQLPENSPVVVPCTGAADSPSSSVTCLGEDELMQQDHCSPPPSLFEFDAPKWKDFTLEKYKIKGQLIDSFLRSKSKPPPTSSDRRISGAPPAIDYDSYDSEFEERDWFDSDHVTHFPNESFADHYFDPEELLSSQIAQEEQYYNRLQELMLTDRRRSDRDREQSTAADLFALIKKKDDCLQQKLSHSPAKRSTGTLVLCNRQKGPAPLEATSSCNSNSTLHKNVFLAPSAPKKNAPEPRESPKIILPTVLLLNDKENYENAILLPTEHLHSKGIGGGKQHFSLAHKFTSKVCLKKQLSPVGQRSNDRRNEASRIEEQTQVVRPKKRTSLVNKFIL